VRITRRNTGRETSPDMKNNNRSMEGSVNLKIRKLKAGYNT